MSRPFWAAFAFVVAVTMLQGLFDYGARFWLNRQLYAVELGVADLYAVTRRAVHPPPPLHPSLVVVEIDDTTISRIPSMGGGTPFLAELLNRVSLGKPRAIVLDLFIQETPSSRRVAAEKLVRELEQTEGWSELQRNELVALAKQLNSDPMVLEEMSKARVILPFRCQTIRAVHDLEVITPGVQELFGRKAYVLPYQPAKFGAESRLLTLPAEFVEVADGMAHTCEYPDGDGVLREDRTLLAARTEERGKILMPSLPVVTAALAAGVPPEQMSVEPGALKIRDLVVPMSSRGVTQIGYSGPAGSTRRRNEEGLPSTYPAWQVAGAEVPAERFRDRVVLIGYTTRQDLKRTPFTFGEEAQTPGVEKIAMHADAILRQQRLVYVPDFFYQHGYWLTLIVGFLATVLGGVLALRWSLIAAPLGAAVLLIVGAAVYMWGGVLLFLGIPALAWIGSMLIAGFVRSREVERERAQLENVVGRYLAPQVFDQIQRDPSALDLEGEEREVTVLFADLRDFTTWSEAMPPRELVQLLNEHLTAMTEVIFRHGGTLDKFVGDCVVAYWGAPLEDADQAGHACAAALEILEVVEAQNDQREARGAPRWRVGVGLNTGTAIVGNMGSERFQSYTVVGDAVNLAARLESLTKDSEYAVLIGERTHELIGDSYQCADFGQTRVKGKLVPVRVFALSDSSKKQPPDAAVNTP